MLGVSGQYPTLSPSQINSPTKLQQGVAAMSSKEMRKTLDGIMGRTQPTGTAAINLKNIQATLADIRRRLDNQTPIPTPKTQTLPRPPLRSPLKQRLLKEKPLNT